jgi:hypothetical protein
MNNDGRGRPLLRSAPAFRDLGGIAAAGGVKDLLVIASDCGPGALAEHRLVFRPDR